MAEYYSDTLQDGSRGGLPRFLSSTDQDLVCDAAGPEMVSVWPPKRVLTAGATSLAALMSSAFLAPDSTMQRSGMNAAVHIETVRVTPAPVQDSADLEERLAFAPRLQPHLAALTLLPEIDLAGASPIAPPPVIDDTLPDQLAALYSEPEPVSLLIVRNLPERATLSDGVPAGIGTWAIGGQDPGEIAGAIEGGLEEAVTAQVDLIGPSGATLATRAIELPAKVRVAGLQTRDTLAVAANGALSATKKLGPKRRAAAFKRKASVETAQEVPQRPKRRKRNTDDAYRAQAAKSEAKVEAQKTPVEEQGAFAKFFSMFTSGSSTSSTTSKSTREYDGSLRGLGMSPTD